MVFLLLVGVCVLAPKLFNLIRCHVKIETQLPWVIGLFA